jgi:hypothetical protein
MFILSSLDLVSQDEMNRILEMFESADTAHDGVLNIQVCFPQTFMLQHRLHRAIPRVTGQFKRSPTEQASSVILTDFQRSCRMLDESSLEQLRQAGKDLNHLHVKCY